MPMCKRPKSEGNVIKGPWKAKSKKEIKIPDEDIIELQENIMFCDNLTEAVMVQMIHSIGENGFDVQGENFLRDMGFIIESVRAALYRDFDYIHPMAKVMSTFTKAEMSDEEGKLTTGLDEEKLVKVIEGFDNGEEEPEPPEVS